MSITSKPDRRARIVNDQDQATDELQLYLDDITTLFNNNLLGRQVQLPSYTVNTLPDASTAGGMIFVTDEIRGAVPAFSNGSQWLRMTDRAVVS